MKLLFCSDIHNNIFAVREMVEQKQNNLFDAVVVASDIGGEVTAEIIEELSRLECPILYVHDNWDCNLRYDASLDRTVIISTATRSSQIMLINIGSDELASGDDEK